MPDKVIVLELKEDYAIAMKEGGGMIRIRRKPGMAVSDRIYVLPEDLCEKERKVLAFRTAVKNQGTMRKIARMATAAAMVVLMIVALLPSLATKAYAVVSIDAQQRVQLEVDQEQSVLKASSIDGSLADTQLKQLKGKNLFDLGPELMEMLGKGPFLVAYATYDGASDPQTEQEIRQMFQQKELVYLAGNAQDISSAEENAQSLGLYMLGLLMREEHSEFLEDFYEEYFGVDDFDDDDDENAENDFDEEDFEHLPLHEMMDLAQKNPEYMKNKQFREALTEKIEERDEDLNQEQEEAKTEDDEDGDSSVEEDKTEDNEDDNSSDEENKETSAEQSDNDSDEDEGEEESEDDEES